MQNVIHSYDYREDFEQKGYVMIRKRYESTQSKILNLRSWKKTLKWFFSTNTNIFQLLYVVGGLEI